MNAWTREDYETQRTRWYYALQGIAAKHGEASWAGRLLEPLAWRREDEPKRDEGKDDVVAGYGYLKGYRDACLRAAELAGDMSEGDFHCIHGHSVLGDGSRRQQ